ncbi:glucokinase [Methyloceanibacter sp.]|uniref:glucokinase n=1 Tax=Methyloceanibacter sp. TaxID=1965321 RepID=UPI003D6D2672
MSKIPSRALVADIGGTNARFALADLVTLELASVKTFQVAEHPTLAGAIGRYLEGLAEPVDHAAIAVAAPVTEAAIQLTNSPWVVARQELCAAAGLKRVHVLNDFEALALSLPHLAEAELHQIGGGPPVAFGTKAVLGPGTGLGVAGLVWSGTHWVPVPGEGGHVTLGAEDERELALVERLRRGRERLSVERALSGPGLSDLHQAVAASHGHNEEPLPPHGVVARALQGDAVAREALDMFVVWLGRFAGDIALVLGARGGVYLGGGIAPKLLTRLAQGDFREAFEHKGRMRAFLAPLPVYVILAEFPALKGAAAGLRAALASGSPV